MSDETKTEVATPAAEETGGKVVFDSQEDFNAVIERRIAKERKKYEDYESVQAELQKLREAEEKRKQAELSQVEKIQKELEEKSKTLAELEKDREWRLAWEEKEAARIEVAMDGLTDQQKEIVTELPLERRMDAVNQFKPANNPANVNINKGGRSGDPAIPSSDELAEIKAKYGTTSLQYQSALKKKYG